MKKSAFYIFPSFFTAKRLLGLDALKSALMMRSCHTSHMRTSESGLLHLHAAQNRNKRQKNYLLGPVYA